MIFIKHKVIDFVLSNSNHITIYEDIRNASSYVLINHSVEKKYDIFFSKSFKSNLDIETIIPTHLVCCDNLVKILSGLNNSFVSEEAACEVVELILKSLGHKVITKEIMAYL
jgi:hypothetical protein